MIENSLFKSEKIKKEYEATCNQAQWLGDADDIKENELYRII
jgi:hypothetical protein